MTTVRIPPVLRQATDGAKRIELPGATVGEVIASLVASHPAIASQLLDGAGELNRFVNIFLNETDIRHLKDLETPTGEQDTLILLPAMAGGAGEKTGADGIDEPLTPTRCAERRLYGPC